MRRFLAIGIIILLSSGFILYGQESSNLYDRMGVITERGLHGAVPEENIDLFSGGLTLKNLDITLPGPNGFDLNIWRVYNSKIHSEYTQGSYSNPQQEPSSWVGFGWMMHMGRILNPDSLNPSIQFPDGRTENTYPWVHDGNILITRNFMQLKKYDSAHGGKPTLYFRDGTIWIFDARATLHFLDSFVDAALVTKIINSYGHEINIEYYPGGTAKLKQITNALGRVVQFHLDAQGNLASIDVPHGNETVTYFYDISKYTWDMVYTRLNSMKAPDLNQVTYAYKEGAYGGDPWDTKELNQIDTSYGGRISYTYTKNNFSYFDNFLVTVVVQSKTVQYASGETATWNYNYGDYSGTYKMKIPFTNNETELIVGFTSVFGPESSEVVCFYGPQPAPNDTDYGWLAGTLAYKATWTKDSSTQLTYACSFIDPEPISTQHIIARGKDWGVAKALLEAGGYQQKNGDCDQYTRFQFDDAQLRKYGFPSDMVWGSSYTPASQGRNSSQILNSKILDLEANKMSLVLKRPLSHRFSDLQAQTDPRSQITIYGKLKKTFYYAFTDTGAYPDFKDRYLLTLLTDEIEYRCDLEKIKHTQFEYFNNGAVKKIRRWKAGGEFLEWVHTYEEPFGPSEITISIDPPGAAGIETQIYRNGTLAKVTKPGYVEYNRTIYPDGLIHTETNQHGGTMTFSYDGIGRITHIAMPIGNPISAAWSQNSVAISRGGNTLTKYWDGMGRNLGFEETGAGVTLYSRRELDGESRVIAESKGAVNPGHKAIFQLNAIGQPVQLTDPTGKWTKFDYAGNTCTITDMKNNQKVLTYSHLPGLVTRVVQEGTQSDSYYEGENRLYLVESSAPDQEKRSQFYSQNGLDQLVQEYHPETSIIDYLYNAEGNLATKTWSDAALTYTYNTANQMLSETGGNETIAFIYDGHGRVQEAGTSTSLWRRYDITYNALGAVTSEKQAVNGMAADKTVAYRYDANGLLDKITYPDGREAIYGNNALLLPESLAFNNDAQRVNAVSYGVSKQPLGYDLANGAYFAATYDEAGRILTSALKKGGSTLLAATYGYDNVGNIASLTSTTPSGNANFSYDAFNRLINAAYPEKTFAYTYDPFGNMLTAEENSVKIFDKTYNWGNRVTGFSYDLRGNLTQGDGFSQVWDKRNRLRESRLTATNSLLGSYGYNERGLRVKAERWAQPMVQVVKPNGGENLYLGAMDTITWSGMLLTGTVKLELLVNGAVAGTIAENLPASQTSYQWQVGKTLSGWVNPGADCKVRVSAMALPSMPSTSYYFYDSGGRLLAEYDETGTCVKDYLYMGGKMIGEFQPSGSKYYYYGSDQINSTRLVTDASGAVVHSAQYDPYGGLYKTWVDTYHPKPGFSGKEREGGSEMDYFGARYYGHKQYRFLSVDPVINKNEALVNPQFWNLYAYCENNPISFIDPDGRDDGALVDVWAHEEWRRAYGDTRAEQMIRMENKARVIVGGVSILSLVVGAVAAEMIIPATIGAEQVAAKFGDKIESVLNRAPSMDIVEKTLDLLDLFSEGKGKIAVKIIETMAKTGDGRSELLKIHQQVSRQLLEPIDTMSANIMKSLQQITGFFSKGGQ